MPGNVYYQDSVNRTLKSKLGERFSVLDISPTAGKGVVSETANFLKAYNSEVVKGGGTVHVPGAVGTGYRFDTPLNLTGTAAIEFVGEGRASKIFRGANMPANKGMIDLAGAKNITFRRLLFDGAVTVPVGLTYASFGEDPAHASLTTNSMFWIHGGEDITFIDCDFEHSGGYAAYLDARAAYVRRIKFINCRFRNNRPHLFGTSGADMNYGSWTGGIFGQNLATGGSVYKVEDLRVTGCQFERNTGNCVWQHGYGFDSFHTRIHVDNNSFLDCGLDGVLFGNVVGGSCIGNSFRRIGYICTTDVSVSVPKWLTNKNATALDTSGLVKLVPYQDNTFLSINGGAINGDGYCYGTISGNTMRVPNSSHPEYDEDHIGTTFGPGGAGANWSQGIVLGNSADGEGGIGVTISGNLFDNLGGTAIGLYGARKCQAVGNLIIVPSTANQQPITIGGFGTAPNQRATDNLVTENTIHYSPGTAAPAIFEDPTYRAFVPADVNRVVKNAILGNTNVFEFQKDPNSDSNTALHFTTNASVNYQHRHGIIREGKQSDSSSALRFYMQDGGAFGYLHMQLQAYRNVGVRGPLFNVAEFGPGVINNGGVITTGNVTTAPFGNAMITGKLNATGFISLTNSTFDDPEANLLDDNYGLLRWENGTKQFEKSISTSGGARVWTPFAVGTGLPDPPDTSVQFNDGGAFGGIAEFVFNKTTKLVTITTAAASPAINVIGGFIQSAQGFLAVAATATAYNSIQAPGGGFFGLSLNLTKYASFTYTTSILPTTGDDFTNKLMLYADTGSAHLRLVKGLSPTGYSDWSFQCSGVYASGTSYNSIQVPGGGFLGQVYTITDHAIFGPVNPPTQIPGESYNGNVVLFYSSLVDRLRLVKGLTLSTFTNHDLELRNLHASGTAANAIAVAAGGFTGLSATITGTTGTTIYAQNGGVTAKWLTATEYLTFIELTPTTTPVFPPLSATGQARLYANVDHKMYLSINGGAYSAFGTGSPGGAVDDVQWHKTGGVFGGDADFTWNNATKLLDIFTTAGTPGISVEGGFIQSAQGFLAHVGTATQYNAIQAPGGGVKARSINATEYMAFTQLASIAVVSGDTFSGKAMLWASTDNYVYLTLGDGTSRGHLALSTLSSLHVSIQNPLDQMVYVRQGAGADPWHTYGLRTDSALSGATYIPYLSFVSHTHGVYMLSMYPHATNVREIMIWTTRFYRTAGGLVFVEQGTAPPLSGPGDVRIYASTDHTLKISTNGAAYGPFTGSGGAPGGLVTNIQWKTSGGAFGGDGDFTFTPEVAGPPVTPAIVNLWGIMRFDISNGRSWHIFSKPSVGPVGVNQTAQLHFTDETWGHTVLQLVPSSNPGLASAVFVFTPGYFESADGFNTQSAYYNAYRCLGGGGMHGQCMRATFYTHVGQGVGFPGLIVGDTLGRGCIYYDVGANLLKIYTNVGWQTIYVY